MTCNTCAFFNTPLAECRRNAPIPVGHRQFAQWPKVKESDWCGQYRKTNAANDLDQPNQSDNAETPSQRRVAAE